MQERAIGVLFGWIVLSQVILTPPTAAAAAATGSLPGCSDQLHRPSSLLATHHNPVQQIGRGGPPLKFSHESTWLDVQRRVGQVSRRYALPYLHLLMVGTVLGVGSIVAIFTTIDEWTG